MGPGSEFRDESTRPERDRKPIREHLAHALLLGAGREEIDARSPETIPERDAVLQHRRKRGERDGGRIGQAGLAQRLVLLRKEEAARYLLPRKAPGGPGQSDVVPG